MITRALYGLASSVIAPAILSKRARRGKEQIERVRERQGIASLERPKGALMWIHAASNGEAISALPLIDRILARDPAGHVLVTTGTITSAQLMAERLPERAIHQYIPVDKTAWVRRFLNHWHPDAAIWIESEFWPALIWEMQDLGRPMALVNGRVSARSKERWQKFPGLSKNLLSSFKPCLAQTPADADSLKDLGASSPDCVGNLKLSGAPLPADPDALSSLKESFASREVWTAASTHPGEEDIVAEAHRMLRLNHPTLLTCIVPRHPRRGPEIQTSLEEKGLKVALRSTGQPITDKTEVYIADTLGELGLFFRLSHVALIGGTLCGGHGGHNPIEAARLSCAIVHGPDMDNFSTIADDLREAGGAITVIDAADLAKHVDHLLLNPMDRTVLANAALKIAEHGAKTVDRVMEALSQTLPPVSKR